jgi:dephospho-CoA kinase
MVIGLTGGIGCGKSVAAACFAAHGFVHVDADSLAHRALGLPEVRQAVQQRWGQGFYHADGSPDRPRIAAKVFAERAELDFLESLVHPLVADLRREAVADASRSYVVEIPLLFEKQLAPEFDRIVCVACSDSVRLQRLQSRGLSPEESERRIKMQMPVGQKVKNSDYVLWNDGDLPSLQRQVDRLVMQLAAGLSA